MLFDIVGDLFYPLSLGIEINQHKDPYEPISIMECRKGFELCSDV